MQLSKPTQLSLPIHLLDDITFDNYYVGSNAVAVSYVKLVCDFTSAHAESLVYLWGVQGVGCSHLLQAACLKARLSGDESIYLPLAELVEYPPEILDNLEHYPLVCLDDLQVIVGHLAWQEALFHLFNRLRDSGGHLLLAANTAPNGLDIELKDLQSRLTLSLVFQLKGLVDEEKIKALQLRASALGMTLSDEVATFILTREQRQMSHLVVLLKQLDKASLQAKHKLTIPFVKQVLGDL